MNDQQIEKEIVEKGKTAPRVTPDHIEGIIAQEAYFTAEDGAFGKAIKAKTYWRRGKLPAARITFSADVLRPGAAQRLHRHRRERLCKPGKL